MGTRAFVVGTAALAAGVIAIGTGIASAGGPPARAATTKTSTRTRSMARAAPATSPRARVTEGNCTAPAAGKTLAAELSANIQGALRGRKGHHAVTVYDSVTGVSCATDSTRHFSSASIVKALILGALLRWHQETGKPLSPGEKSEATLMITQSDNDAATALWDEVGISRLRHFLDLAKMTETQLGQDGYWGLTQVTAHDEMLLLELLAQPNPVLSNSYRSYQLGLMARVIPGQRWGAPAGAPAGVTVHVKNGWLPDGTPLAWHINSIGAFTGKDKNYMIAVLTDDNPTEEYGIGTVQDVARLVHRDLNGADAKARLAVNVAPAATELASSSATVPALP
jgi:beta-lactamase class A